MRFFLSIIKTIIYSNLLVSLSVAAFTHLTYLTYSLPKTNAWLITLMVFCFTFTTYNGQRIFRLNKYKKIGERLQWVIKYRKPLTVTSLLTGIVGLACLFFINPLTWLLIVPMGVISLFYVVPIPLINKGLRDIPYLKVFVIAFVWALIIIGLPFLETSSKLSISRAFLLSFIEVFIFILAITLPFDVRDLQFDQTDQLKTMPQALGINNTIVFSEVLLMISILIYYTLEIEPITFVALVIGHFITAIIIALTNKNRKELFYAGWVESSVLFLWACVTTARCLFPL